MLFYYENIHCVCSFESSQRTIISYKIKKMPLNFTHLPPDLALRLTLEPPMSRKSSHAPRQPLKFDYMCSYPGKFAIMNHSFLKTPKEKKKDEETAMKKESSAFVLTDIQQRRPPNDKPPWKGCGDGIGEGQGEGKTSFTWSKCAWFRLH